MMSMLNTIPIFGHSWTAFVVDVHLLRVINQVNVQRSKVSIGFVYFPFQILVSFGTFDFDRNIVV